MFKKLLNKITRSYRQTSIQVVISLFFTVVTVLGMVTMGLTLSWRYTTSTNELLQDNYQRLLYQVNTSLDTYLRQMMRVSDTLYYRNIKATDFEQDNILEPLALLYEENRESIVSIALFDKYGALVAASPMTTLKEDAHPEGQEWFLSALNKVENLHFSTPHVQNLFENPDNTYRWVVSLSRQVEITRKGVIQSGVLLVDISFDGIEQICRDVNLSTSGYVFLASSDGELIYHPQQQLIYAGLADENNEAAAHKDGAYTEKHKGAKRQVIVKTVGYTGWKLIGVIPQDATSDGAWQVLLFGVFLFLFSAFLMVLLNFRISAYISTPLRKLEKAVKELEIGRKEIDIEEGGCYEVQRLGHSIRSMVSTMYHLTDDIIEQEEQKRSIELEVLQSQINPHFLYNTLDSVIWMTEAGQHEGAVQMVTALARLFRISLSKGKSMIPIKEEMEHAQNYMTIQQVRYKNRFTAKIAADEDVENLYALKLIVQPLLENAIYHGLPAGTDEGVILVHAYRSGDDVLIDVVDNGVGIPPKVLETLLDANRPATTSQGSGIGLLNVHNRIRLTFGKKYGVTVFSEPDEGTTVRLCIPMLQNPQKGDGTK